MTGRNKSPRSARAGGSIEFAGLLDRIPADAELADLVMFPIATRSEAQAQPQAPPAEVDEPSDPEPNQVSRFADAGVDDDRLPLQVPRVRRRRR